MSEGVVAPWAAEGGSAGAEAPVSSVRDAPSFLVRPGLLVGAVASILVLALVSTVLAWHQYDAAKRQALTDLEARVVAVNGILDVYFGGQFDLLEAVGGIPVIRLGDTPKISAYLSRLDRVERAAFNGGLIWIDRRGIVAASGATTGATPLDVSDRPYFERAVATRKPYVSSGLIGRRSKRTMVVIAVPTFDAHGRRNGVLAGRILLRAGGRPSRQALALGFGNLTVVDRNGRLLRPGLPPIANRQLLRHMRATRSGVDPKSPGIGGGGNDHAIAYATSARSGWITLIDRPRSRLFASGLHSFELELGSVAAAVALVLALLTILVRRAHRRSAVEEERSRSWSRLTRQLMSALAPEPITTALLESLAGAFPDATVFVRLGDAHGRLRVAAGGPSAGRANEMLRQQLGLLSERERGSHRIELTGVPAGERLHVCPVRNREDERIGVVSLVNDRDRLRAADWELLDAFADQASTAIERTTVFAREHELSLQLQRALLPDELPSVPGLELSGRYMAGGPAVEVGGDWYDAVLRPDGVLQLCVGDVGGKGVAAATVMGALRNAFHAYALEFPSPADIVRRMRRHIRPNEFVTVACVSVDLEGREVRYSLAGHLPPLLLDRRSGEAVRLGAAAAPPLGVAAPDSIGEASVPLPSRATLALYTDGLVERRERDTMDGILRLEQALVRHGERDAVAVVVDELLEELGETSDDLALLLVQIDPSKANARMEFPADASYLPEIRRGLRSWLDDVQADGVEADDVVLAASEACNNAIEHAYRGRPPGNLIVTMSTATGAARVVVEDHGYWRPGASGRDRGRGIPLMKELMRAVEIEQTGTGTRVTLERALHHRTGGAAGTHTTGARG